jgi:AmiR/NasT family two-component response regulator
VRRVLIIAREEIVAALLGLLVDLQGYEPVFASPETPPATAIARLLPGVAIVDCDHPSACEEDLFLCAQRAGTAVILFSPSRQSPEIRRLAQERKLASFALPIDPVSFGSLLEEATAAMRTVGG